MAFRDVQPLKNQPAASAIPKGLEAACKARSIKSIPNGFDEDTALNSRDPKATVPVRIDGNHSCQRVIFDLLWLF
jgi:hypothetical protein